MVNKNKVLLFYEICMQLFMQLFMQLLCNYSCNYYAIIHAIIYVRVSLISKKWTNIQEASG